MNKPKVVLGQEMFVLSPKGDIVRTKVAKIEERGYKFLNGSSDRSPHWTTFDEALRAACKAVETQKDELRTELRQLAARVRELQSFDYKWNVNGASYKVTDLRDDHYRARRSRSRQRKHIAVPETYLEPGERVYLIITPLTRPYAGEGLSTFRPHSHFVLETQVKSVCLSLEGKAHYTYATRFQPEEHFLSRAKAINTLRSYSEPGTLEHIHLVTREEEEKGIKELYGDDDLPF